MAAHTVNVRVTLVLASALLVIEVGFEVVFGFKESGNFRGLATDPNTTKNAINSLILLCEIVLSALCLSFLLTDDQNSN